MPDAAAADLPHARVNPARVLWAGPVILLASVIVVMLIRFAAVRMMFWLRCGIRGAGNGPRLSR